MYSYIRGYVASAKADAKAFLVTSLDGDAKHSKSSDLTFVELRDAADRFTLFRKRVLMLHKVLKKTISSQAL
jgi:hypothetical protein